MSAIARLLVRRGLRVSGSDIKQSPVTDELAKLGIKIFIGHDGSHVGDARAVIYSSAIREDNPELMEAGRKGALVMKRAEALAWLMKDKKLITVSGSHGKTTTASLASLLLLEAGLKPTIAVGGILKNIDTNASFGEGEFFVAEADESDGSFLYYTPDYSILTNIDREHLDYYRTFEKELEAFAEFISATREGGWLFCCRDDERLLRLAKASEKKVVFFGMDARADIYPGAVEFKGLTSRFDCFYRNKPLGNFFLSLGGLHNVSNSLAVIALGLQLGIGLDVIKRALKDFKGARRRLEIKFQSGGYTLIDDYAHHPAEIKATLEALRALRAKRVTAVFQPHRYSRTRALLEDFGASFEAADRVIITDIYPAGEAPIEGVDAARVCDTIRRYAPRKEVSFLPKAGLAEAVLEAVEPGDLVITLGAGDITKECDALAEKLKRKSQGQGAA